MFFSIAHLEMYVPHHTSRSVCITGLTSVTYLTVALDMWLQEQSSDSLPYGTELLSTSTNSLLDIKCCCCSCHQICRGQGSGNELAQCGLINAKYHRSS